MREDYGTLPMSMHDDGFGDMAFDTETPDLGRAMIDPNLEESLFAEDIHSSDFTKGPIPGTSRSILDIEPGHHLGEEGFGDDFGRKLLHIILTNIFFFLFLLKILGIHFFSFNFSNNFFLSFLFYDFFFLSYFVRRTGSRSF